MRGGVMSWKHDKKWSDKFLIHIKSIIGTNFISEPPIEEDQERNTDLMVLKMDAIRFGCRIRRNFYYNDKYKDQFTIRIARPSNNKTELTKIIEGWGDYFFYGFSNEDESDLCDWFIGDLKVFRLWFNSCLWKNKIKWELKYNNDKSSDFMAFNKCDLPPEFIYSSHKPHTTWNNQTTDTRLKKMLN